MILSSSSAVTCSQGSSSSGVAAIWSSSTMTERTWGMTSKSSAVRMVGDVSKHAHVRETEHPTFALVYLRRLDQDFDVECFELPDRRGHRGGDGREGVVVKGAPPLLPRDGRQPGLVELAFRVG